MRAGRGKYSRVRAGRGRDGGVGGWLRLRREPHVRAPRREELATKRRRWLLAGQVPKAHVDVDPACADLFDGFRALHPWVAPGVPWPVELNAILRREGPRRISVWYPGTEIAEVHLVGYVSAVDAAPYEEVVERLAPDEVATVLFTAVPGFARYDATVEGRPPEWSETT